MYILSSSSRSGVFSIVDRLELVNEFFSAKPVAKLWQPPSVELRCARKPVRDFVHWMDAAPVVSQRAMDCLKPMLGDKVEFLPLITVKKVRLYAINVLSVINCLDIHRSTVDFSSDGFIGSLARLVFYDSKFTVDPVIFKIPQSRNHVFVSESVSGLIIANRLSGCVLIKPSANPFARLLPDHPDVLRVE